MWVRFARGMLRSGNYFTQENAIMNQNLNKKIFGGTLVNLKLCSQVATSQSQYYTQKKRAVVISLGFCESPSPLHIIILLISNWLSENKLVFNFLNLK